MEQHEKKMKWNENMISGKFNNDSSDLIALERKIIEFVTEHVMNEIHNGMKLTAATVHGKMIFHWFDEIFFTKYLYNPSIFE